MGSKKLPKRTRDQVPVMLDFAEEIETQLEHRDFGRAEPSLEPTLSTAREYASKLKAWLSELDWLVANEHKGS